MAPLSIKLWLDPDEYDALRARLARERLADLALSDRLAREWAELDVELGQKKQTDFKKVA